MLENYLQDLRKLKLKLAIGEPSNNLIYTADSSTLPKKKKKTLQKLVAPDGSKVGMKQEG